MAIFFFVLGLEIKQELTNGQLASVRNAAVPAAGALGGMLLPAVLYLAFNLGGAGVDGWGIPMATDVAFALGVLALLGSRVPAELKVLLLALAIVDDVGAIVVIAAFYSDGLEWGWFGAAVGGLVLVALFKQARVRYLPVYVVLGAAVWLAMLESGVHATIAGVVLGLLAPARPFLPEVDADRIAGQLSADQDVTAAEVRSISFRLRESIPVTEHLENLLHPWTSYLDRPAVRARQRRRRGLRRVASRRRHRTGHPRRRRRARRRQARRRGRRHRARRPASAADACPTGITPRHVLGMAGIAGIGFTVSLFVAGLAFERPQLADQAKIGVLVASVIAAGVGAAILGRGRAAPPA